VVLVYIGEWGNVLFRALWYWKILGIVVTYCLGRCGTGIYWGLGNVVFTVLWYFYIMVLGMA
jgi:hypothetical protein